MYTGLGVWRNARHLVGMLAVQGECFGNARLAAALGLYVQLYTKRIRSKHCKVLLQCEAASNVVSRDFLFAVSGNRRDNMV